MPFSCLGWKDKHSVATFATVEHDLELLVYCAQPLQHLAATQWFRHLP